MKSRHVSPLHRLAIVRVSRRRGWSLIEQSVTITLLATLSVLAFQVLSLMLHFDSRTTGHMADSLIRQRFVERFRDDVHAARSFELVANPDLTDEPGQLVLEMPQGFSVQYHCGPEGISREVPGATPLRPRERDFFHLGERAGHFRETNGRIQVLLPGPYPTRIDAIAGRRGS